VLLYKLLSNSYSYVRDRRDKKLKQTVQLEAELQEEINNLTQSIDEKRAVLAKFDKEINEGGATLSNIRDNLRLRRLKRDITAIQAEIDGYDMEETARTRRNFEKVFTQMENKLSDMKARVCRSLSPSL
jgi:DNA repair protein RAD50